MNERVQFIVSPSGEPLAVLPEQDYLMLLAASEDDEGEPAPEFVAEIRRRSQAFAQSRKAKSVKALKK
jgi:hypothetical protein